MNTSAPLGLNTASDDPISDGARHADIISCTVIMLSIATLTVGLRFYTRKYILNILHWDDWCIAIALMFSVGMSVGQIRQTLFGLGRHIWTVPPNDMRELVMEQWYTFLFYGLSLSFTKFSIIFLYMKILTMGPARIACYIVLAVVTICDIWVVFSQLLSCVPLQAVWDQTIRGACLPRAVSLANSILHIITDFMIFVLPLPSIIKLQLPRRQKIMLIMVFGLGFLVCFMSIARIIVLTNLDFSDFTREAVNLVLWGAVEVNLAIICASLTTLKPLMARLFPTLLASMSSRYHTNALPTYVQPNGGRISVYRSRIDHRPNSFAKLHDGQDNKSSRSDDGQQTFAMSQLDVEVAQGAYLESPDRVHRA